MTPVALFRWRAGVLAGVVVLALGGLAVSRAGTSERRVVAIFSDASELVPGNDVRVNDVRAGRVASVKLEGLAARVSLRVDGALKLPKGTRAEIRQTSLLGEPFVALIPAGSGALPDNAVLPLERTGRGTELEEIVGLGGDLVAQVNVDSINRILHTFDGAFGADPEALGRLIDSSAAASAMFDRHRDDLGKTIDQVSALAASLAPHTAELAGSVEALAKGMGALSRQRSDLGALTTELARLSERASTLLAANEQRLSGAGPQFRQVLGEVVGTLDEVERTVRGLPAFNKGWACAADGHYLNFVFPLTPEAARVDYGPGRCHPELGPRGRENYGQVRVDSPGVPIDDPLGTGKANERARNGDGGLQAFLATIAAASGGAQR